MLEAHRPLLADTVRIDAYRAAIRQLVSPESVALDLGAGSGILSVFACQAGARRVFAVEENHSADLATFLTKHLGLKGCIEVLHARSTTLELPERADLLVTETMGSFGLEEQILSSVIDARHRLLRPDATLIPNSLELFLVPVEVPDVFARHVGWWNEPYHGLDLAPFSVFASNVIYVADIVEKSHLSAPQRIMNLDLTTIEDPTVSGRASFVAARDGLLCGFGGWFAAGLAPGIVLSNDKPGVTHWQQAFLPLEQPVPVERGTPIEVHLETDDGRSWRWRGVVNGVRFDQTTWLAHPPCYV
jgi:hypothetical protein